MVPAIVSRRRMSRCSKSTLGSDPIRCGSHRSSSNPQESLNGRHNEDDKKESKAVIIWRLLFVAFILVGAGVFGCVSF